MSYSSVLMGPVLVFLALTLGILNGQESVPACDSPIYCQGELLDTIQRLRLFPDSKTFVDMSLKKSQGEVLSAFKALPKPISETQGRKFVSDHFSGPGEEFEPWEPSDLPRMPSLMSRIKDPLLRDFAWDLCQIWKDLGRKIKSDVKLNADRYSLVYLPNPFIVPGGRFRETYYWDTYWVVKGLLLCDMTNTVKGILENFAFMIQKFGLIPNGGRVYYSRRSQPPFFIPMMYDYYKATGNLTFIQSHLAAMETEYAFWMTYRSVTVQRGDVIHVLNRYATVVNFPRPESYYEDVTTANGINSSSKHELYQNLASAAESGWDFSSRWFSRDPGTNLALDTTRTTNILPVDLNSILCMNENILSEFFKLTGDEVKWRKYVEKFNKRQMAISDVLWNSQRGVWQDLDIEANSHRDYFYASNIVPLYASCTGNDTYQTENSVLTYLQSSGVLQYDGGFPTSLDTTGQQWDFPNGWPPLQHMAIWGMSQSRNKQLKNEAYSLTKKWVASNWIAWNRTRNMYEKYSTKTPGKGGSGGEYGVQEGFGWSNGVVLDLLDKYGDRLSVSVSRDITSSAQCNIRTRLFIHIQNIRFEASEKLLRTKFYFNSLISRETLQKIGDMLSITVTVLLQLFVGIQSWVNDYDHAFTFTCPQHQAIQRIVSHHDNHREDRVFDFTCSKYEDERTDSCYWTEYVNDFDQPVVFQCPHGGVVTGVSSYHDNHREDRRFKFYCCERPGMCLYNCFYTGFVNNYDGDLDYTVPDGHVMRGWTSVHDNGREDRIFDFDVCLMQQCIDVGNPGETVIGK